jgi:hypothetical protein
MTHLESSPLSPAFAGSRIACPTACLSLTVALCCPWRPSGRNLLGDSGLAKRLAARAAASGPLKRHKGLWKARRR